MAGLTTEPVPAPLLSGIPLARQQMRTVVWLRWRIFVNTFRFKGATGELIAKILSYPLLAMMVVGPSIGAGFGGWYVISNHHPVILALILWGIFGIWQMVGITTSATGPSFDLASLIRFPIKYRDYFLLRLSFGLLDPPNLVGTACLVGMTVGITIAEPTLFPWAALTLLLYAAANVLFSRMIYAWLERFLAQRKTRELVTVLILFVSLGFQVLGQFTGRLGRHSHHETFSPWMVSLGHNLEAANWFLPPGLTAAAINQMRAGAPLVALAALFALATWAFVFLLALHRRMFAQYRGENLSEAPAATKAAANKPRLPIATAASPFAGLLSPAVSALLVKEYRYLIRSGPKLYALVLPAFMVFLFSSRNSGLAYAGIGHSSNSYVFSFGCMYLQLMLVAMLYNSLGNDARGIQFYFMAPIHMREVLLAKNILTFVVLVLELALIYVAAASLSQAPGLDLAVATIAASLFIFFLSAAIGNIRSIVSPKVVDPTQVRKQNISGLNSLISLLVTTVCGAISSGIFVGSRYFLHTYWPGALVLTLLVAAAISVWFLVYGHLDQIAADNQETLATELCKAG